MSFRTHARHGSATMPNGIAAEPSRVDLNAFVIVCYGWHALPHVSVFPTSTEIAKRDVPKAMAA